MTGVAFYCIILLFCLIPKYMRISKLAWIVVVCSFLPFIAYAAQIHEAAKSGDAEKLRQLLDKDPSLLYVKDEQGKTPLHWATGRGQTQIIEILLNEYKVDVNVRNDNEGTALHVAASQAQPEAARILIKHGALVNAKAKDGATPLHYASLKGRKPGHIEVAQILVDNGADVNARASNGATPLSMAMKRQNTEIIRILRSNGAK